MLVPPKPFRVLQVKTNALNVDQKYTGSHCKPFDVLVVVVVVSFSVTLLNIQKLSYTKSDIRPSKVSIVH